MASASNKRAASLPTPDSSPSSSSASTSSVATPESPPLSFAQLVKDKSYGTITLHPSKVTSTLSVRPIREEGVIVVMKAIRDCGWTRSPLYASDRGDNRPPVLLEGSHRLEALRRLLSKKQTPWLLRGETPSSFKVDITVLKNLTPEEEIRIGRESNKINSSNVQMTLVDQLVAMHKALKLCREKYSVPKEKRVKMSVFLKSNPDYRRYARSTLRAWKRVADGFGPEALQFLLVKHSKGFESGGEVKTAFSKKTIMESQVVSCLKSYPGVQFWYLKRLVHLEGEDKVRQHNVTYFKELPKLLRFFADAMIQFATSLEKEFKLSQIAKCFRDLVQIGHLDKTKFPKNQERRWKHHLSKFAEQYLWSAKREDEVGEVVQQRRKDENKLLFPHIFYEIVAQLHFNKDYDKTDEMFNAPKTGLRPEFTTCMDPTRDYANHLQIIRKRRRDLVERREASKKSAELARKNKKRRLLKVKTRRARKGSSLYKSKRKGYPVEDEEEEDSSESEEEEEEDDDEEEDEDLPLSRHVSNKGRKPQIGDDQNKENFDREEGDKLSKEQRKQHVPNKESTDKENADEMTTSTTAPSPHSPKTTVKLDIMHSQDSGLPSTISKELEAALRGLQYSPTEKASLKVSQQGKILKMMSFPCK